jgi:aromatase
MKIVWLYHEQDGGTLMTWIQDFEMDPGFTKFPAEKIEGFINDHSTKNMAIFKKVIEQEAAAGNGGKSSSCGGGCCCR